ncbi:MAG: hypothetical protein K2X87_34070 [Gemmataceae bacterium]|nr:hypothetical protein [Gemmataceae bacterium]
MSALKCPNPACPYLFDPSGVPPGVVLTCPRCGMRFTLGAPPPAGSSASPPSAADLDFGTPGEIARPRRRPDVAADAGGSGTRTTIVLVVVAAAVFLGVGATVYFRLFHTPARPADPGPAADLRDKNLALDPPGDGWVRDEDLRAKLGPPFFLAYRKGDPDHPGEADPCLAFAAKDYGTREARPGELRDGLTRPLAAVFEDISPEDLPGAAWLGRPAAAVKFHALPKGDGARVVGQAHAVGYKGFGYWAVGWGAEADAPAVLPELESLRAGVRLLDAREKWAAKEAPTRTFAGPKGGYEVVDGDGVWVEPDPAEHKPADADPAADLLLTVTEKRRGSDFAPEATFLVLLVDNLADEPLKAGRKHVEDRRAAEVREQAGDPNRATTFTDHPGAETAPAGAPVARFRSTVADDKNQARLHVVSAVRLGDRVAVAYGWCAWADRATFEDRLVRLAASLRERK